MGSWWIRDWLCLSADVTFVSRLAVGAGLILLLVAYIRYRKAYLASATNSSYFESSKTAKRQPESDSEAPGGQHAAGSISGLSDRGFLAWLIGSGNGPGSDGSSNNPARRLLGLQTIGTSSEAGGSSANSRCVRL